LTLGKTLPFFNLSHIPHDGRQVAVTIDPQLWRYNLSWIADVMEQNGLSVRRAPNRIYGESRTNPCPIQKREATTEALRHYALI
jgi:hypothetical protein